MNIIRDKTNRLNLSPMDIYFIVNEGESSEVINFLEDINNTKSLTQGVFKFHLIQRDKNEASFIKNFSGENNVVLRLVENLGEGHQYLIDQINLTPNNEFVLRDLKKFLLMACRQDIANIRKRITSYSSVNPEKDERIESFDNFISILQHVIEEYKEKEYLSGNSDSNALRHAVPGLLDDIIAEYPSFGYDMAQIIRQNKNTKKKVKDKAIARICDVIKDILGVNNFEDFDNFNGKERDKKEYLKYIPKELFIELPTQINKKLPKRKRVIEFPLYIRGEKLKSSIKFISADRGILYALILVKQREGTFLKRRDFFKIKPQESELKWMKDIYDNLNPKGNFLEWYEKMGAEEGHVLSVIKSHARKQIDDDLENNPEIIFFLNILTTDTRKDTKYKIALSPENILLPGEIEQSNKSDISE